MICSGQLVLTDGAINERVNRYPGVTCDPELAQTSLLYRDDGVAVLTEIYEGYFQIASDFKLPMLTLAPTWKTSRLRASLYNERYAGGNGKGVQFLLDLRKKSEPAEIYIGGDMGCKGDAYNPTEALGTTEAAEFHQWQCEELANAGADFLIATALPALSEAKGIAQAMSLTKKPYILSFIIRPNGVLLDGHSINRAVSEIDSWVHPAPDKYLINCVHPSTMISAYRELSEETKKRILGLKANTSSRTPEELNNLEYLDTISPEDFGRITALAQRNLGLQCVGGCCGTDDRHLRELARVLSRQG